MFLIFAPHPLLYLCRLPDGDILVQKRYDTCNPILYELNYLRPFLGSPVLFYLWFCRPTSILAQELILISKDYSHHLHSRWFILLSYNTKRPGSFRIPAIYGENKQWKLTFNCDITIFFFNDFRCFLRNRKFQNVIFTFHMFSEFHPSSALHAMLLFLL